MEGSERQDDQLSKSIEAQQHATAASSKPREQQHHAAARSRSRSRIRLRGVERCRSRSRRRTDDSDGGASGSEAATRWRWQRDGGADNEIHATIVRLDAISTNLNMTFRNSLHGIQRAARAIQELDWAILDLDRQQATSARSRLPLWL